MSDYFHQRYPCYLYHHKLAPEGKIFQNIEETKLLCRGWVDTPAKFPKPSKISVWLQESVKPWWAQWEWLIKAIAVILSAVAAAIVLAAKFLI